METCVNLCGEVVAVWTEQDKTILFGSGPLKPILVEAGSLQEGAESWEGLYGEQYAQAESLTAQSMAFDEEAPEDMG